MSSSDIVALLAVGVGAASAALFLAAVAEGVTNY
jgi:hypothetical protein